MMLYIFKLFNIRRGEEKRALLMMTYIFLVVSALMIIKPVSHAQFLSQFGAKQLAFVFMLVAVCAAGVVSIYGRLLEQMDFLILIRRTVFIFIGALIFIWFALLLKFWEGFILYFFFISVSIFAVIATSQFWILANIIFNAREAKRLFGFIGAGAIVGGILGGYFTKMLVPLIGSENCILLGALSLLGCDRIVQTVWKSSPAQRAPITTHPPDKLSRSFMVPLRMIRSSRHLTCLAAIILISVAVAKFVDYQFNAIASEHIQDEEKLAAFLGFWYSNLNVVSLLIQLFITRKVVGVFGVGVSLLFLPAAIFIGAVGVLILPALLPVIFLKVADGSLKNSIQKSGIELLSLPVPPEIRNPARSFIDVFGDSFATGITGLLLMILTVILNVPVRFISLTILVLVGIWIWVVRRVRREYLETVRRKMELVEKSSHKLSADLGNESVIGGLIRILSGRSERRILEALNILHETHHDRFAPVLRKLLGHESSKVRLEALRQLYFYETDFSNEIQPLIHDENTDIQTEAMQYLFRHSDDGQEALHAWLDDPVERTRTTALLCATRESRTNQEMKTFFEIRSRVEERIRDLRQYSPEEGVYQKVMCARMIGAALIPELHPFLHILFRDPSHEVLQAALLAAGQTRDRSFLPVLMRYLAQPDMEKTVREALVFYQTDVTELFVRWMSDPKEERMIRLRIPRVIANTGTQRAADALTETLEFDDPEIHYEIIKALNHLRKTQPQLRFDDRRIVRGIIEEARLYSQTLAALRAQTLNRVMKPEQQTESKAAQVSRQKLVRALEKKLDHTLEVIFRLLGLKYPPEQIETAYQQMCSRKPDVRTNVVEYLDNLLDWPIKRAVIPLLESTLMDDLVERTLHQFGLKVPGEFECLSLLLEGKDAHLKSATLSLIATVNDARYVPQVCGLLSDTDKSLQIKAEKTLKKWGLSDEKTDYHFRHDCSFTGSDGRTAFFTR